MCVSADVKRLTTQRAADKSLLNGARTERTFHKKVLQQRTSAFIKDREKLLAEKAVVETKIW